jgi:predicted permease
MQFLRILFLGLQGLFSKTRRDKELEEELHGFLDAAAANEMRSGKPYPEALRAARVAIGSREAVKQQVRSVGWEAILEGLWQDFRFSIRMLAKSPGFSAVAIVSLALGIGANTAIFTLIENVMLKSLPVQDPQDLVSFGDEAGGGKVDGIMPGPLDLFPYEFYQRVAGRTALLKGVCAYSSFNIPVTFRISNNASAPAVQALSFLVSGNFFEVLEAAPLLGRALIPTDAAAPGHEPVVVASYQFWRDKLLGDPAAVGQTIGINGTAFTLVGVMPETFRGVSVSDETPDFWAPLTMQTEVMLQPSLLGPHALYWLHFMGRRQPDVALGQIQAWMTSRLQRYITEREGPVVSPARQREIGGIFVEALAGGRGISDLRAQYSALLKILMGAVLLVLLIACANLANLLLARAAAREREIATRLALGSGRARVVRQLLTEALLLALGGGILGTLFSWLAAAGLINFVSGAALHTPLSPAPDVHVLLFTLGISLLTGLLFGLAPALRVPRLSLAPAAQASVRSAASAGGPGGRRIPKVLIAAQVMLTLVLLASAGLFARTLHNLENRDFGFNRRSVLLVDFNAKFAGYQPAQLNGLYARLLDRLAAVPGVQSASLSGAPPIVGGNWNSPIYFIGEPTPRKDPMTLLSRVGPRYFETMNIPLLRGRTISATDSAHSLKVVVVNQAFADYFFPQGDALGHTFTVADPSVKGEFQIAGIVKNSKYRTPREEPQRMAYLPVMQLTGDDAYAYVLEIRTAGEPTAIVGAVRRAFAAINPDLAVLDVKTMAEQTDLRMANEILISRLSGFFSVLALSLACIGLYGVMTYNVLRRSNEIGIRMTLGAQAGNVLWLILRESLLLLGIGIALGLPVTMAVTRLFRSELFGLTAADPLTVGVAVLVIGAVMLLSAFFPARRAARVDPMVTLRYQ